MKLSLSLQDLVSISRVSNPLQAPDFARTNVVALARETWKVAWEKPGCLFFRVDWCLVKSYDMTRSDIYLNLSDEMLLVLKSAEDLSQGDDPQIPNDFPNNFLWHPVDHFFFISVSHWIRLASIKYQWISLKDIKKTLTTSLTINYKPCNESYLVVQDT